MRIDRTLDWSVWWVSLPLLAVELRAAVGLALFTFSLWDVDGPPPPGRRHATDLRLAVLIPTYNEAPEILLSTIAAAVAVEPAHETWVLDDGARPEIEELAHRLGARYLARTDRTHAKSGNVNHALGIVDADVVAILDADHVAGPNLFTSTRAYFDDPRIAVVQSPQDFYNADSFEQEGEFQEQALFYRVLQAGKNRWGAAFWCGTGALVRVAALRDVGGVATDTVTEDIHTTIRLHRRGWRSVYHNEVLARGLAAADAGQYQLQRLRWGTGAMQVLRTENPMVCSGLTLPQRLSYAATLLGWFDSWRSLAYLVLPMLVLATGAVPIRADALTFGLAFGATFLLQRVALVLLGRGRAPQLLSAVFELVRMPANLRATLTLIRPGDLGFRVTPKGRTSSERARIPAPRLLQAVLVASVAATLWFVLSLAGFTPVRTGRRGPSSEPPSGSPSTPGWSPWRSCASAPSASPPTVGPATGSRSSARRGRRRSGLRSRGSLGHRSPSRRRRPAPHAGPPAAVDRRRGHAHRRRRPFDDPVPRRARARTGVPARPGAGPGRARAGAVPRPPSTAPARPGARGAGDGAGPPVPGPGAGPRRADVPLGRAGPRLAAALRPAGGPSPNRP